MDDRIVENPAFEFDSRQDNISTLAESNFKPEVWVSCLKWLRIPSKRWKSQSWWPWETLSWVLSCVMFSIIAGILRVFDGRDNPSLGYGVSLNTIVSLLASIGTAALAVPVSESIAQAKWLWFRRSRLLSDFDTIDQASRGPVASIILLVRHRGGFLATLGAFITIAFLAIGPFVQQVISYDLVPHTVATAQIPITRSTFYFSNVAVPEAPVSPDLAAALYFAILQENAYDSQVKASCPSGNCTFPQYQSLAFCDKCADISDRLILSNNSNAARLPNGFEMQLAPDWQELGSPAFGWSNTVQWLLATYDYPGSGCTSFGGSRVCPEFPSYGSVAFKNRSLAVMDYFTIFNGSGYYPDMPFTTNRPDIPSSGWSAMECVVELCIKTLNATVINGVFNEIEVSRILDKTSTAPKIDDSFSVPLQITDPSNNKSFSIDAPQIRQVINWMTTYMHGTANWTDFNEPYFPGPGDSINRTDHPAASDTITSSLLSRVKDLPAQYSVPPFFIPAANLANSLTTWMRSYDRLPNATFDMPDWGWYRTAPSTSPADSWTPAAQFMIDSVAVGQSWENQIYIHVHWPWMILPFFIIILTLVLMVLTILKSKDAGFGHWKSSSTAVMLHGVDDIARRSISLNGDYLDHESKRLNVVMRLEEKVGWKLTLSV